MEQFQIDPNDNKAYPMGLTILPGGVHVNVVAAAQSCSLLLFLEEGKKGAEPIRIPFPEDGRKGDVWEMTVRGNDFSQYRYAVEIDGVPTPDPCGRLFCGWDTWGDNNQIRTLLKTPVCQPEFDWEGDCPLSYPYQDCVVYHTHVRGFTKHASSGVSEKGTFHGIIEKIPYLKELGITVLELMPVTEFQEIMMPQEIEGNPYGKSEPTGKINYWGYGFAYLYAPKESYSKNKDASLELKQLVKALHKAGIELVVELYFTGKEKPAMVLDVVHHWVREYHLDGIHLMGQAPVWILADDPYLAKTKIWANSFEGLNLPSEGVRHLGECNDGFLTDMRRVLKGDEEQMNALIFRNRRSPGEHGVINYIANANGFTLMDLVSYERKHNEANGENNQDGAEYNFSWNCGLEGPTRKKKLMELRKKQIKNALLLVFLSQGTPLLLAGDEFGNTQGGNNNAYCQDNDISWLNWSLQKSNRDIFDFVKHLIAFRKAHPVFHMETEPRVMDYLACGQPDISYHGVKTWCPEFENFRRQIGILYCGDYGIRKDGAPDDSFFVTYNMHWEPHEFALPNLAKGKKWYLAFDTDDKASGGFYPEGGELVLPNQKQYMVPSRTILVFVGK